MKSHCRPQQSSFASSTTRIFGITAIFAAAFVIQLFITSAALAQTGAVLVLAPWEDASKKVETQQTYTLFGSGHSDGPSATNNFDLQIFQSHGRVHLGDDPSLKTPGAFNLGFSLDHMQIGTDDPMIPDRLVDAQVAIGTHLFKKGDWDVALVAGIGFAGSNAFGDSHGYFGQGDLIFTKQIDQRTSLSIIANYDGNRAIFPDIPLPAFAYTRQLNETFQFTVGFPWSRLKWEPKPQWTVRAGFAFPSNFSASVEYQIKSDLELFLALSNRYNAYHVGGDDEHRRLFFRQRKIETGANWNIKDALTLTAAVGFAFDQKFTRGWDVRDTDTIRELSDEPFVRFALRYDF